ncbi:MAG: excinuclease ABC subunit UvrB [Rikenellaceae bacterium]
MEFKLSAEYKPTGDQPEAIEQLTNHVTGFPRYSTLMGVTGSGKTFTIANVIANANRPVLILSHNKTLAAQLYGEFKNFFPDNAVEYFVSYYDYYQPEAYLPSKDVYIEKDLSINDEIEKMRLSTVSTLLSGRRDVIVVSSVSCIYGMGNPDDFEAVSIKIKVGDMIVQRRLLYALADALYTRTERELMPATFRVRGESVEIMTAYGGVCYRVSFYDFEVETIDVIDPISGRVISTQDEVKITPANVFVTTQGRIANVISQIYLDLGFQVKAFEDNGRMVEAQRLKQRVEYDLEMIKELGYCSGIENYSRYFDNRKPGQAPFCLLNYFSDDFITVIDESHVMIPQIRGMYGGDRARKENLVEYGFRLEAAKDNRPLTLSEFDNNTGKTIFVSATPADLELIRSETFVVEQLIRPTGLIDPPLSVHINTHMVDHLMTEIDREIKAKNKILVTTITKRMAEELSKYFDRAGVRNRYIHSDVDTLERVEILDDLRKDMYDVLIGVNLLREGLDLPEVGLVAITDADKEGFLRNVRSITQIAGRAARHPNGRVIMYGDKITDSMKEAIEQSNRRRMKQVAYNIQHEKLPSRAQKSGDGGANALISERPSEETMTAYPIQEQHYQQVADSSQSYQKVAEKKYDYASSPLPIGRDLEDMIEKAKSEMEQAAKDLDFTKAIAQRDKMYELIKIRDRSKNSTKLF